VRPCVAYHPYVETKHPVMDVVIVRENEEDVYGGIEHRLTSDVTQCLKLITRGGSERIVRYAFEYARKNNRKKVTCFTKDNIMKITDGLFHKVFDEIATRRRDPDASERVDVLSLLIRAGLPDRALRDELLTLLLAGHETTATGLAWACERLVRHPEVMARARTDDAYLDATIKEVLRIRPVVLDVARVVAAPARVAGYDLEPGTMVVPAITPVHRAGDVWPDPEAFDPGRFLDGSPAPYSWIPFGGGVRRCLGAAFAQLEMKVVLREVLQRTELAAPPDARPEVQRIRHVTLVPERGGEVLLPAQGARGVAHADDAAGHAGDDGVVGNVLGDDGAGAEHAVVADGDAA